MCNPHGASPSLLLLSLESYTSSKPGDSYKAPPLKSCLFTGFFIVVFLTAMEHLGRFAFSSYQHLHPLLEVEVNRQILARHLFVDTFSCAVVATLGWFLRDYSLYPVLKQQVPLAGFEQRLFTYNPSAFRLSLFFFAYQIKNSIDTVMWNDGPEFIFHHVFSLITAWGAMTPGCGHFYTVFFFGLSEISTAVLCVLANFDEKHGVIGLGEAFPIAKVTVGVVFVMLFVMVRCLLWPVMAYYFVRDIRHALKGDDPKAQHRRGWMKFFLVSLSGITVLQVAWLGEIISLAQIELAKVGLL